MTLFIKHKSLFINNPSSVWVLCEKDGEYWSVSLVVNNINESILLLEVDDEHFAKYARHKICQEILKGVEENKVVTMPIPGSIDDYNKFKKGE